MGGEYNGAKPFHHVKLSDFYIGQFDVTFDEYDLYCDATGHEKPSDEGWGRGKRPIINVSWNEANDYCQWLSQKTGKRFRLPTEAEWEFASRRANNSHGYLYPGSNNIDSVAWYNIDKTQPVGEKQPNEIGLYDMAGNVWQLVSDWLGNYSSGFLTNPTGPAGPEDGLPAGRVIRGGFFGCPESYCRIGFRYDASPGDHTAAIGFRIAMDK